MAAHLYAQRNAHWENGEVLWFTIEDMRKQGRDIKYTIQKVTKAAVEEKRVKLVPKDSVLLCCSASIGEVAISTSSDGNKPTVQCSHTNIKPHNYRVFILFCINSKKRLLEVSGVTTINFVSMINSKSLQ